MYVTDNYDTVEQNKTELQVTKDCANELIRQISDVLNVLKNLNLLTLSHLFTFRRVEVLLTSRYNVI